MFECDHLSMDEAELAKLKDAPSGVRNCAAIYTVWHPASVGWYCMAATYTYTDAVKVAGGILGIRWIENYSDFDSSWFAGYYDEPKGRKVVE